MRKYSPDSEVLKEGLRQQLPDVIERLYSKNARWLGNGWRIGNTAGEPGNSLAIEGRDQAKLGLWHDHATNESGDILDLIAEANGTDFKGALEWACDFLGVPFEQSGPAPRKHAPRPVAPPSLPQTEAGKPLEVAHPRSLDSAARRLWEKQPAIDYLRGRGLTDKTIRHFHLGLDSYEGKNSSYQDAVSFPLLDADGTPRKRWFRLRVPGLTKGGPHGDESAKDWATGSPITYWATPSRNRTLLFVCEGAKDAWWLWQALQGSDLADQLCVITSSHGSGLPAEWKQPDFWQGWDAVFAGQDADDAGDSMAAKVRDFARRDVHRVRVPEGQGKDWTDYFKAGHSTEDFKDLLTDAPILDFEIQAQDEPVIPQQAGLHAATPVDVNSAYVNGHLYVPFRVLDRQMDRQKAADGTVKETMLQRYRTLVLRSDGVVCSFDYLPAPQGTPREDMVMALSDGTIIERAPVVDEARSTFSLKGITRLREASRTGTSAMTMPPEQMLSQIERHLRSATILPYSEDYALLTYVALTTYAQQIFDAVPLVLVVGAAGSGKTDLGRSMVNVSCNASIITGQTSAATAARVLDQLNGLAVFDDLEEIGSRSNGGEFSEFVQQLKVSYKKDTSTKSWTNTKTMKVERLNFYGVKLITNTQGAEGILSTRMLRVYTKKLSKELLEVMPERRPLSTLELQELRDNLHIWVMENVSRIDEHYRTHYGQHGNRQEEITAPLRVLSELLPHPTLSEQLKIALDRQNQGTRAEMSSVDLLHEAARNLIRDGYQQQVAMKNLLLEMKYLVGPDWGRQSMGEIPEWQEPRWVGKMLRSEQIVDPHAKDKRSRLPVGQTTVLTLEDGYVDRALKELLEEKVAPLPLRDSPLEFCPPKTCEGCPFYDICDMRPEKQIKYGDTAWREHGSH